MSAYNLGTDPYNQHVVGAYIAGAEGPYFGVPFMAYVGWTAVAFLICLTFRLVVHKIPIQPVTRVTKRFAALPIVLYIGFMAFYIVEILLANPVALLQPLCSILCLVYP